MLIIFYQNPILSQTLSAYLQTAVVCCYEYDPVVTTETAQVALNPYKAF